uniref:tRNA-intron lyase n=1 Tax=Spongospora subterranea TaxID=70186 RepID=A0A0H5QJC1_9EUKA|eukprot:CRZ02210.1 hypothetical protein [Spongospora subterranea]
MMEDTVHGEWLQDGGGVVIKGSASGVLIRSHRLGGGEVARQDTRTPDHLYISTFLSCEEAHFAISQGWLKTSGTAGTVRLIQQSIFEELWNRHMWVTPGLKFGANMLAYQGSPDQYHSTYIIIVKQSDEKIPVLDIISVGRLATAVNKLVVVAACDSDGTGTRFLTIKWNQRASNAPRDPVTL